jgi:hypothetical protein
MYHTLCMQTSSMRKPKNLITMSAEAPAKYCWNVLNEASLKSMSQVVWLTISTSNQPRSKDLVRSNTWLHL